jgi:repressor LexA
MNGHDGLSERQRSLMTFIEDYVEEHGRPPTNREIGNGLGIPSTGHVDYHLKALEKKGYISREQRTSRGIRVLMSLRAALDDAVTALRGVPILGTIAAGSPWDITDRTDDTLDVNPQNFGPKAFALRVRGKSMIEDGILDGDFVVIDPIDGQPQVRDIIVATNMSGGGSGSATLKRFFKEDKRIKLQPANSEMDPIFVSAKEWDRDWQVQGRLAAVIRLYDAN